MSHRMPLDAEYSCLIQNFPFPRTACALLTFGVSGCRGSGAVPVCRVRTDRSGGHNHCRSPERPDHRATEIVVSSVGHSCLAHVVGGGDPHPALRAARAGARPWGPPAGSPACHRGVLSDTSRSCVSCGVTGGGTRCLRAGSPAPNVSFPWSSDLVLKGNASSEKRRSFVPPPSKRRLTPNAFFVHFGWMS